MLMRTFQSLLSGAISEIFDLTNAMINATDVGAAASSAQECVDLIVVADPAALAISFETNTGACKYSTSLYSYTKRAAGQQLVFYLRVDNVMKDPTASDCLTVEDAEYLIAKMSFGDEQCVGVSDLQER